MAELAKQLSDLVGEHTMEAVPRLDVRHPFDPDASGAAFTLSGNTYLVFEDPYDGYRSMASPLLGFIGHAYQLGGSGNTEYLRPPLKVFCTMEGEGSGVLTMRDERGQVVFEIGTNNADDYYPSYIARWSPPSVRT